MEKHGDNTMRSWIKDALSMASVTWMVNVVHTEASDC